MQFNSLTINNFGAIETAEIFLNNKGLVSIEGENTADASASSNGAGKTTVMEALLWVLFGSTTKGVASDEVIRWGSKGGCTVRLHFTADDKNYLIYRKRKVSGDPKPNGIELLQDVSGDGVYANITAGTDTLTQEKINNIIGCNEEIFKAAVYYSQEDMQNIPAMTDKEIKSLLEKPAGLEAIETAASIAKDKIAAKQIEINTVVSEITQLQYSFAENNQEITNNQELIKDLCLKIEDNEKRIEEARTAGFASEMKEAQDSLKTASEAYNQFWNALGSSVSDVSDLKDKLEKAKDKELSAALAKGAEFTIAENNYSKAFSDWQDHLTSKAYILRNMKDLEEKISDLTLHSSEKQYCETCGHELEKDDYETTLKGYEDTHIILKSELITLEKEIHSKNLSQEKIDELKAEYLKLQSEKNALTPALSGNGEIANKIKALITEAQEKAQEISDATLWVNEVEKEFLQSIAEFEKNITNANAVIKQKTEDKDALIVKNKKIESQLFEKEKIFKILEKEIKMLKDVSKTFSASGIRGAILDTITPFLNNRTSYYLAYLADGDLTAEWSSVKYTAKGDLTEKFTILCSKDGNEVSFKSLSGGQKRKVQLACALALQDLIASRATKPINLWIGDEIDNALDNAGLERLMQILDEKSKEKGTVIIISHNSLRDWIRENTVVTLTADKKGNKVATIEGILTHD